MIFGSGVVRLDGSSMTRTGVREGDAVEIMGKGRARECGLQLDVERAGTGAAAVHRAEHLDVADRIEAEAFGHLLGHQLDEAIRRSTRPTLPDSMLPLPGFAVGSVGLWVRA